MRQKRGGGLHAVITTFVVIAFGGGALVASRFARAGETEPATKELETLVRKADFDAAEITAQKLLTSGSLPRPEVARVYLQLGIVASAKRDTTSAEAAFRRALRLDGDLRLSPSVGPHVAATLARAKAAVASTSAAPTVALSQLPGTAELSVEAPARRNDDGLARRLSIRVADVGEVRDLGEAPLRFSLSLPVSVAGCATATASVLDEYGNELWPAVARAEVCRPPPKSVTTNVASVSAPVAAKPVTPTLRVTSTERAASSRPIPRSVWIAAAAAGAAAVGTAVLGFVALERRDEYNDSFNDGSTFAQQQRLNELASTAQHRATGAAIVTGLLAVTTVALYIGGRF